MPDFADDTTTELERKARALSVVALVETCSYLLLFYFWQIAEWSAEDVKYVDGQLTAYRGRIERDDWVNQANELAATPSAAHRPTEH